jgi:integrase/recombinase XerD
VTINCNVSAIRTFFRFCLQEGYLARDPSESLRKLREPQVEIRTLAKAEVLALLGQADRRTFTGLRDYWIILTLYDTGLRVTELCTLKLRDIDWGKQQFRVMGKGSKERRVPFSPQVRRAGLGYMQQRADWGARRSIRAGSASR